MSSISSSSNDEYYRQLFNKFQNEIEEQQARSRQQDSERAARLEENHQHTLRKQQESAEEHLNDARNAMNHTLATEREYNRNDVKRLKENYDRLGRNQNFDGRDAGTLANQLDHEYENAKVKDRLMNEKYAATEAASREKNEAVARNVESQTEQLRASHREEVDHLRSQVREVTNSEKERSKQHAQALVENIRDQENSWLLKEQRMASEHDRELKHLRSKEREIENYLANANSANLKEKDAYFTDVLHQQQQSAREEQIKNQKEFNTQMRDMQRQRKLENANNDAATRTLVQNAREQQRTSLEKQASAYQDLVSRTRQGKDAEIRALERALQTQKTSDDTLLIPPAAEHAVRSSLIKEYEKQFDAEKDRNQRSMDYQVKASTERLQDVVREDQDKYTKAMQENEHGRTADRKEALNYIHEIEYEKQAVIRNNEIENERAQTTLTRSFGTGLERQRRDYESMIENMRNDASAKLATQRQESEFEARMKIREEQNRQNDTVRAYERKLQDQRNELQLQIDDIKLKGQNDLREAERRGKQSMEEQSRRYEQRIAQLEAQHKERERYLESSFQEEIDRVRRSNELLLKKKS